jgi:hypothetical protein
MAKRFLQTLLLVDIQMDWVLLAFNHRRLDSFLVVETALNCYRSSDWCMIESLNWIGSDVIRPDCSVDPTDPSCSNPANVTAENQRIANLYDDTILCSECFMKLFYEKLGSDFLPDSDHSDYLVDQFQDIQDVCSTTIGNVSTKASLVILLQPQLLSSGISLLLTQIQRLSMLHQQLLLQAHY